MKWEKGGNRNKKAATQPGQRQGEGQLQPRQPPMLHSEHGAALAPPRLFLNLKGIANDNDNTHMFLYAANLYPAFPYSRQLI